MKLKQLTQREKTKSNFETTNFLAMTNFSRDAELQNANDWLTRFPASATGWTYEMALWLVFCDWLMINSQCSQYRLQECSGTVRDILEKVEKKMIVTGQNCSLVNACVQKFPLSRCK